MKNKKTLRKIFSTTTLIALLFTIILTAFPSTSNALGLVTITVKHPDPFSGNYSWFVYEKEGGTIIQDMATVKNVGTEPATVSIYAVDATSNEAGSFILTFPKDPQNSIGIWTEIESGPLHLNPQQSIDVPFKIHVPQNATPGQYTGGIIVENSNGKDIETSTQEEKSPYLGSVTAAADLGKDDNISSGGTVSVKTRIGTRIYLTVPGEIVEDIELTAVNAGKDLGGITRFQLEITNNGNMSYEPKAHIEIYDTLGNLYETIDSALGTSSPNTVIRPTVKMTKTPIFGNYSAKITVTYNSQFKSSDLHGASPTEVKDLKFWIIPWEIILMIGLLILTSFAIAIRKRYAKKTYTKHSENYVVQPEDDLIKLGKARNVPWKKIAKYNNIKPPYIIKPGQTIKIPKIK